MFWFELLTLLKKHCSYSNLFVFLSFAICFSYLVYSAWTGYSSFAISDWCTVLIFCWTFESVTLKYMLLLAFCTCSVSAINPAQTPFPDIRFSLFSEFISTQFSSEISLSSVLCILFSLTENPELLNLHARQKHPKSLGETKSKNNGWINSLARAVETKLGLQAMDLIETHKQVEVGLNTSKFTSHVVSKLDLLIDKLALTPYHKKRLVKVLKPVTYDQIQGVQMICPKSMSCTSENCQGRALQQITRIRDIPIVTLIKGNTIYKNAIVLTGECSACKTLYMADHESYVNNPNSQEKKMVHLINARFLKLGSNLWADQIFSATTVNGMYSFHGSTEAYTEFWNNSFGDILSRRHIWKAFVQESIRTLAEINHKDLETADKINTQSLVEEAYNSLGNQGVINVAPNHECSECSQPYKAISDLNDFENNPNAAAEINANAINNDYAPVKMVVLDGIVMGPTHCAFLNCTATLANARGGVFCTLHEIEYGLKCRIKGCQNIKIARTEACETHKEEWKKHVTTHSRANLAGFRRVLRRNINEPAMEWQPNIQQAHVQPHDEAVNEDLDTRKHYFTPSRFYCVETICAPCGVVIAWTKFHRSESPSNILKFLERVYPTQETRPSYVCIDKACLLVASAISQGKWDAWQQTTRMIVDSYHYINHKASDYLCSTWCNPAPDDGSAPNLVVLGYGNDGTPYAKRAFNTQVNINLRLLKIF